MESIREFRKKKQVVYEDLQQKSKTDFTNEQTFKAYFKNAPTNPAAFYAGLTGDYFLRTKDNCGNTLLHAAVFFGDIERLEYILSSFYTDVQKKKFFLSENNSGEDVLHFYIKYVALSYRKNLDLLNRAREESDNNNNQNENIVEIDYKYQIFEILLQYCRLNKLLNGHTYLMYALREGATQKLCWLLLDTTKSEEYVTEYLKPKKIIKITSPMDLRAKDVQGSTAYSLASKMGYHELLELLPSITSYETIGFLTKVDDEALNKSFTRMKQMVMALNVQALEKFLKEEPKKTGKDLLNRVDKETGHTLLGILAAIPTLPSQDEKVEFVAEVLCKQGALVDYALHGTATPLFTAISTGKVNLATYLKAHDASITGIDSHWNGILHRAVLSGKIEILDLVIQWLLNDPEYRSRFRAIVKTPNKDGHTPLSLSVSQGKFAISCKISQAYDRCRVSVEEVNISDADAEENLRISALNVTDVIGNNHFLQSVAHASQPIFKSLFATKNQELISAINKKSQNFLHLICEMKLFGFLRDEKNKKNVFSAEEIKEFVVPALSNQDVWGNTPFHVLFSRPKDENEYAKIEELFSILWQVALLASNTVHDLLLIQNSEKQTILHKICEFGYQVSLKKLISPQLLADHVNVQDKKGYTPLHQAVVSGHTDLVAMFLQNVNAISLCTDQKGFSFFHHIIISGNVELWRKTLKILSGQEVLNHLMKLRTNDAMQQTALHLIMGHDRGEDFFKALIEETREDFLHNELDQNSCPPMHYAIKSGHKGIVKYYKSKTKQIYSQNHELHYPIVNQNNEMFDLMLQAIPESKKDSVLNFVLDGFTPLMRAMEICPDDGGSLSPIVKTLAAHAQVKIFNPDVFNGNIELDDPYFDTVLHVAAEQSVLKFNLVHEKIKSAVEVGAGPTLFSAIMVFLWPNQFRQIPFTKAIGHGDVQVLGLMFSTLERNVLKFLDKKFRVPDAAKYHLEVKTNLLDECTKIFSHNRPHDANAKGWVGGQASQQIAKVIYRFVLFQAADIDGRNGFHHAALNEKSQVLQYLLNLVWPSKEEVPDFLQMMLMPDKERKNIFHHAASKFLSTPECFNSLFRAMVSMDGAALREAMLSLDDKNNSSLEYLVRGGIEIRRLCKFSDSEDDNSPGILQDIGFSSIKEAIFWAAKNKQEYLFVKLMQNCSDEELLSLVGPLLQCMMIANNGVGITDLLSLINGRPELRQAFEDSVPLKTQLNNMLWPLYIHEDQHMKLCVNAIIFFLAGESMASESKAFEFYAAAYDVNLLQTYIKHFNLKAKDIFQIVNSQNQTLIQASVDSGNVSVTDFLIKKFTTQRTDRVRKWLLHRDDLGKTLTFYAVQSFDSTILREFKRLNITYSLEINKDASTTLIQWWAGKFDNQKVDAIREIGLLLFEKFPDNINRGTARSGVTPMHRAAGVGNWPALELLLDPPKGIAKASVFCLDAEGRSPLHDIIKNKDIKSAEIFLAAAYKQFPDLCSNHSNISDILQEITVLSKKMQPFPELDEQLMLAMNHKLALLRQQIVFDASSQEDSDNESEYSDNSETLNENVPLKTTCGVM